MATKIRVEQINAIGTPNSATYLRGDGAWFTPSGGFTINEQSFSFPDKSNGRVSILIGDAGVSPTSKVFVQLTKAGEENEEDENEIRIGSITSISGGFYIEFDTLGYVYGEFIIYYLIA